MASYGKIYEFVRDSQNGAEIHIVISKKNYAGESAIRPLGRAPLLKRENNGHVFGTSLEIYAECKVDGEFAQFYTSSADEYKIEVYKDDSRIWSGFISPELYSEPDIAPPYDVQIIATDGLGELRNYEFENTGAVSVYDHLSQLISHTGLSLETVMASDLRYYDGASTSEAPAILDFRIDLSHEDGASCYDVLQNLLSSLNASITQFNDRWFVFRETDFIRLASADSLKTFIPGGTETLMDIASFGSAKTCAWWPIGQLSSVIEPAKNRLTLISPNSYKENALDDSWTADNGASYDEAEGAYILPDEGSYITQKLDFAGEEVGYRLALRVSARNVGSGEEDQALGVRVVIDARSYSGERQYWLIQPASSDRGIGSYRWKPEEGTIEAELAVPSDSDTSADTQDIDIILPLYKNNRYSYIYAKTVEVTVYNPAGIHDIYVYGVSLSKYDQFDGYQANVVLNNGAREEGLSIDLSLSDGSMTPAAGNVFISGIPLLPEADEAIASWAIGATPAEDYIRMMSKDYSRMVASPRMSYKGVLNVPRATIPVLFVRDNTFYFPRAYTYDLYNDELEVDLISIPAVDLSIESLQIAQIADARGVSSSGASGGGGGIGSSVDLTAYAKKVDLETKADKATTLAGYGITNAYTKGETDSLLGKYVLLEKASQTIKGDITIEGNLVITGDVASGGEGGNTSAEGTVTGVTVSGVDYTSVEAGLLDLTDLMANYALKSDSTKVSVSPSLSSGKSIGVISVDGVGTTLYAPATYAWSEISEKPNALLFGGTSSQFLKADGSVDSNAYVPAKAFGVTDANTIYDASMLSAGGGSNLPSSSGYGSLLTMPYRKMTGNNTPDYAAQIYIPNGDDTKPYLYYRTSLGNSWNAWRTVLDDGNYSSYALPLTGGTMIGSLGMTSAEVPDGAVGLWGTNTLYLKASDKVSFFNSSTGAFNEILHSGNVGEYALKIDGSNAMTSPLVLKHDTPRINFRNASDLYGSVGFESGELKAQLMIGGSWAWHTLLHSGNVGDYTGKSTIFQYRGRSADIGGVDGALNANVSGSYLIADDYTGAPRHSYGTLVQFQGLEPWIAQFALFGADNQSSEIYYRRSTSGNANGASAWKQLAFTDSNVASATKLATVRNIWGQYFDGTGDVTQPAKMMLLYFVNRDATANSWIGRGSDLTDDIMLYVAGENSFRVFTNGTQRFIINPSGNVTIGSSDLAGTDSKLYVDGSVTIGENPIIDGASRRILMSNGGNLFLGTTDVDSLTTYVTGNSINFRTGANSYVRITITDSGNVGIGTTDPAYKLDVAGTGRFTSSIVVGSTLNVTGHTTINGGAYLMGGVEVHGSMPYIDFHFENATDDYTSRIIEIASGNLAVYANWLPNTNNARKLGNSDRRWSEIYGVNGDFSNAVTVSGAFTANSGATITGDVTINGNLIVSGDVASGGTGQDTPSDGNTSTSTSGVLTLTGEIPVGSNIPQSSLDAVGLTDQIIADLLIGKYHHVMYTSGIMTYCFTVSGKYSSDYKAFVLYWGDSEMNDFMGYRFSSSANGWYIEFYEI